MRVAARLARRQSVFSPRNACRSKGKPLLLGSQTDTQHKGCGTRPWLSSIARLSLGWTEVSRLSRMTSMSSLPESSPRSFTNLLKLLLIVFLEDIRSMLKECFARYSQALM